MTTTQPAPTARRWAVMVLSAARPITQPPPWIHTSTGHGPSPSGVMTWHGTPAMSRSSTVVPSGASPCRATRPRCATRASSGVISSIGGSSRAFTTSSRS